ncbi:polar residue-rich protein 2 [Diadegma fenestrale ichnovirus]|nr:polar residue-rich protein 2 [Diadegma fenestrale ichnovirus]
MSVLRYMEFLERCCNSRREDERDCARKEQEARKLLKPNEQQAKIERERKEQEAAKRQDIIRLLTVLKVIRPAIPLHLLCKVLICRRMSS